MPRGYIPTTMAAVASPVPATGPMYTTAALPVEQLTSGLNITAVPATTSSTNTVAYGSAPLTDAAGVRPGTVFAVPSASGQLQLYSLQSMAPSGYAGAAGASSSPPVRGDGSPVPMPHPADFVYMHGMAPPGPYYDAAVVHGYGPGGPAAAPAPAPAPAPTPAPAPAPGQGYAPAYAYHPQAPPPAWYPTPGYGQQAMAHGGTMYYGPGVPYGMAPAPAPQPAAAATAATAGGSASASGDTSAHERQNTAQ